MHAFCGIVEDQVDFVVKVPWKKTKKCNKLLVVAKALMKCPNMPIAPAHCISSQGCTMKMFWVLCVEQNTCVHQKVDQLLVNTSVTKVQFHPWFSPRIPVVSQGLDLELMCIPRNKMHDLIRNTRRERNNEFPRCVLSRCCVFPRTCGNKSMSQWWNMLTVQSILPMKMPIMLECSTYIEVFLVHCDTHEFLICAKSHLLCLWNIMAQRCWKSRNITGPVSVRVRPCVQRAPGPMQAVALSEAFDFTAVRLARQSKSYCSTIQHDVPTQSSSMLKLWLKPKESRVWS